jgi:hypothetical protein
METAEVMQNCAMRNHDSFRGSRRSRRILNEGDISLGHRNDQLFASSLPLRLGSIGSNPFDLGSLAHCHRSDFHHPFERSCCQRVLGTCVSDLAVELFECKFRSPGLAAWVWWVHSASNDSSAKAGNESCQKWETRRVRNHESIAFGETFAHKKTCNGSGLPPERLVR